MSPSLAISYPEDAHNSLLVAEQGTWFQYRNEVIADLISKNPFSGEFCEIGAGNGIVSLHLQNLGYDVAAVEPVASGAANCLARSIKKVRQATLEQLALPENSVGAVGAFDVIEHLNDPLELLLEAHRVLRADGIFFVTVPAHRFLWSSVDVYSGHFRRYSKKHLVEQLASAGFVPLECRHFMNLLVLPAFLLRVLPEWCGRKPNESDSLSETRNILKKSYPLEVCVALEKKLRLNAYLPFGTSLIGAFRKI
jgi:SAM-dependent methyltransferase